MATATLQILSGEHTGQTFLLEERMIVGRDVGTHIRINDRSISRKHASIEQRDGGFYVLDLGSQNGTKLNGIPVTESLLPGSCRLQFGSVEAEFTIVSGEGLPVKAAPAGGSEWQSLSPSEESVLDDIFRPPSGLEEIDRREAQKKAEAQKKLFDIAYVVGMILIVAAGAIIFLSIGKKSRVMEQTILLQKYDKGRGEQLIPYLGSGRITGIRVRDEDIADVVQDDEYSWLLNIRGKEVGETKAYLADKAGKLLGIVTIVVRGQLEEEEPRRVYLSNNERVQQARLLVEQADNLREDSRLWRAIQLYQRASDLCRPIDPRPDVYPEAIQKARAVSRMIDDEAARLKQKARLSKSNPAYVVKYLNEICQLIPDPNDLRHQRAKIIIYVHYPEMMHKPLRRVRR